MSLEDPSLTVQSLDESLIDLVEWEGFGIHLPGITHPMITMINRNHPGNCIKQKQALYDEWLRAHPHATWGDVVNALKRAKENNIAAKIEHKVKSIQQLSRRGHTNITPMSPNQLNMVEISVQVEEAVVTTLQQLSKNFKRIEDDVEDRCNELVTSGSIDINKLLRSVRRSQVNDIVKNSLQGIQNVDHFFEAMRPHYTFLDCDLLEEILEDLPNSADVSSKLFQHKTDVRGFKKENPIRALQNQLKPLVREAHQEKIFLKVFFELEEAWGNLDLNRFELFLETMFPRLSKKMRWYEVVPGSICITLVTDRDDEDTLVSMGKEKQGFLRILGVASLSINGNEVFNEHKSKSFSFESALLEASLSANTEALLFLLNVIQVSVDHQDKDGNTALDIAVDNHIEVAQILLNAKANPNHQKDDGNTPLHIACYKGYTQLALMLIKYGANPSIPNTKGDTPFLSSIRGNMMEVITMIAPKLPQSQIPPALLLACRLGYSDIISFLLQYIDPPGSSKIHQYCANGDLALAAEHIVQFNEDINSSLVLGITPLMITSSCGHIEVVECLIEANADVNRIDEDGYSPLAYAITGSGSVPVIECLLQAGANPCITVGGDSLLKMAKQQGYHDLVDLLLQFMALQLYNLFSFLVEKIQEDLTSEIEQHKITLQEIKSKLLSDPEFSHIESIAEASSCSELFTVLKPHYDFLSWKVISCLSERLKHDGYFKQVEIVEEDLAIQSLPQAISLFPQSLSLPSLSSTGELSVSLDKQWGDKTLFNLRGLNALFFSSLTRLMSHLTVSVTQQEIIVSYQIPRSTKVADRIKLTVSQEDNLASLLGITSIKLDNEVILQIGLNKSFSFDSVLRNSLTSSLPSTEVILNFLQNINTSSPPVVDNIISNCDRSSCPQASTLDHSTFIGEENSPIKHQQRSNNSNSSHSHSSYSCPSTRHLKNKPLPRYRISGHHPHELQPATPLHYHTNPPEISIITPTPTMEDQPMLGGGQYISDRISPTGTEPFSSLITPMEEQKQDDYLTTKKEQSRPSDLPIGPSAKSPESAAATPLSDQTMIGVLLYLQHRECNKRDNCQTCKLIDRHFVRIANEYGQIALTGMIKNLNIPGAEGTLKYLRKKKIQKACSPHRPQQAPSLAVAGYQRQRFHSASHLDEEELTFSSTETDEDSLKPSNKRIKPMRGRKAVDERETMGYYNQRSLPLQRINETVSLSHNDIASTPLDYPPGVVLPRSFYTKGSVSDSTDGSTTSRIIESQFDSSKPSGLSMSFMKSPEESLPVNLHYSDPDIKKPRHLTSYSASSGYDTDNVSDCQRTLNIDTDSSTTSRIIKSQFDSSKPSGLSMSFMKSKPSGLSMSFMKSPEELSLPVNLVHSDPDIKKPRHLTSYSASSGYDTDNVSDCQRTLKTNTDERGELPPQHIEIPVTTTTNSINERLNHSNIKDKSTSSDYRHKHHDNSSDTHDYAYRSQGSNNQSDYYRAANRRSSNHQLPPHLFPSNLGVLGMPHSSPGYHTHRTQGSISGGSNQSNNSIHSEIALLQNHPRQKLSSPPGQRRNTRKPSPIQFILPSQNSSATPI